MKFSTRRRAVESDPKRKARIEEETERLLEEQDRNRVYVDDGSELRGSGFWRHRNRWWGGK